MLSTEDIKKIGEEMGRVVEDNIIPQFTDIHGELTGIRVELTDVQKQLYNIDASMVTKAYLDDKLADLEGSVIVRQRKEDQKVNLLIDILQRKSILESTDIQTLKQIQVFPPSSGS